MDRTQARTATLTTALAACFAASVVIEVSPIQLTQTSSMRSLPVVAWTVGFDTSVPDARTAFASGSQAAADVEAPTF